MKSTKLIDANFASYAVTTDEQYDDMTLLSGSTATKQQMYAPVLFSGKYKNSEESFRFYMLSAFAPIPPNVLTFTSYNDYSTEKEDVYVSYTTDDMSQIGTSLQYIKFTEPASIEELQTSFNVAEPYASNPYLSGFSTGTDYDIIIKPGVKNIKILDDRISSIGDYSLFGCITLSSLSAPNLKSIGETSMLLNHITQLSCQELTSIGDGAFCAYLMMIFIGSSEESEIGQLSDYLITDFYAPKLEELGYASFVYQYLLSSANLGNIKTIKYSSNNYLLSTFGGELNMLSVNPFFYCFSLKDIKVSEDNQNFKLVGNNNAELKSEGCVMINTQTNCVELATNGCENIILPNDVTKIKTMAFGLITGPDAICIMTGEEPENMRLFKTLDCGGVEEFSVYNIVACNGLESIIAKKAKTIGVGSISQCDQLSLLNIENAESIASNAFSGLDNLQILELSSSPTMTVDYVNEHVNEWFDAYTGYNVTIHCYNGTTIFQQEEPQRTY